MTRRQAVFLVLALLVLAPFLCYWIYDRYIKTDVDHIRETLAAGAQGLRDRSPGAVVAVLSDDFRGPMNLDRHEAHRIAFWYLMQKYRAVEVTITPDPVDVTMTSAASATVSFHVKLRGKPDETSDWEEFERGYTDLKATLQKVNNQWLITRIEVEKK